VRNEGHKRAYHIGFAVVEPFRLELLLLALQRLEFLSNIGVDKVGNILALPNFGNDVFLPFRICENVILFCGIRTIKLKNVTTYASY